MERGAETLVLELRRALPAPPSAVFAALADEREVRQWFGPEGFSVPDLRLRPRVGDRYRLTMQPPDGSAFHVTGEFRAVEPPQRLAFTFEYEPPDPDDVPTLVELSVRAADDGAEIALTHSGFATEARRALHRDGWTESFDRLERHLSPR